MYTISYAIDDLTVAKVAFTSLTVAARTGSKHTADRCRWCGNNYVMFTWWYHPADGPEFGPISVVVSVGIQTRIVSGWSDTFQI
jgi:hypothetical protein